jgi:hypothetical protein
MNIQQKWRESRLGIAGFAFTMILACPPFTAIAGRVPAGFTERDAEVNGVRILCSIGGERQSSHRDVGGSDSYFGRRTASVHRPIFTAALNVRISPS